MSIEQVRLIELITYYKLEFTNEMEEMICQIHDKKLIEEADKYIRENNKSLNEYSLKEQLQKYLYRQRFKVLFKMLFKKEYSDDIIATIMYLLSKTSTPEFTQNRIIEILEKNKNNEKIYSELIKMVEE